ncbi:sigma-70 family RNA polymerase sigma factor [Catenuloplanes indicus]|uniref:RNA polymerase sigma-70 factor (ECF subfamily) n=1 Tax=Catenuloplanes indicus TaxID=137267 RepID=A0AAE3VVF1_9ACTN|nr:sigma-70 family RNA polymerase sigma factor [Catenuloplanes indicus]MDQ0364347.1 RNA polymerase sigma-70 factor (ECF subfamily) [Catenuloplanes indicus]
MHDDRLTATDDDPACEDARLRSLYEEHRPWLHRRLMRLLNGDRHLVEDVLQETAVRAWRHPDARGPDGTWRSQWLYTVARNLAFDHIRALRRASAAREAGAGEPTRYDAIDRMMTSWQVRDAVAQLPDRLRAVLIEVYLLDRPMQETADRLGVPLGTVKSRLYYALRALRASLAEPHQERAARGRRAVTPGAARRDP